METVDCLAARVSAARFDPERAVDGEDLRDLVRLACRAPSAFNLQPWRFVLVTDPLVRGRLRAAAGDQAALTEAPAVVVVLGDLRAVEMHAQALKPSLERGDLAKADAERWIAAAARAYNHPQAAREEAIRASSMAAMCLMLAARDRGLASAPFFAFDGETVRAACAVGERYLPVLLLALGHPLPGDSQRQRVRLGLGTVLHEGSGESLEE